MTSFFGGDLSVSHFTVGTHEKRQAYNAAMDACGAEYSRHGRSAKWLKLCEKRTEAHKQMKEDYRLRRERLKEIGFKTPYFQFKNKDEHGKAVARAKAEAFAKEWSAKAGFDLEINEGCFL
jgi:hypothetical protein